MSKIENITTIVTHANCADGMASAILLHDVFPSAEIVFMSYGTEDHRTQPAKPGMLFCDFSPHPERAKDMVWAEAWVLDHHKSAKDIVSMFGERGIYACEEEPGQSGATLAFDHVWKPKYGDISFMSRFAYLAGVRDTWMHNCVDWEEACAQAEALTFWPANCWLRPVGAYHGAYVQNPEIARMISIGPTLRMKQAKSVKACIKKGWGIVTSKGTRLYFVAGGSRIISDAAEMIDQEADLVISFNYEVENLQHKLNVSLRSHTNFDCAAFAKSLGGGGHAKAAGFTVPFDWASAGNPYRMIDDLVNNWEKAKMFFAVNE